MDDEERLCIPKDAFRMMLEEEPAGDSERSAALDGWVAAFEREMEQSGDFAKSIAAMKAHGCFDVRAVVERWILANPTGDVTLAQVQRAPKEPVPLRLVLEEAPALEEAAAPPEPPLEEEPTSPRPEAASSPDVAYFRSLLQGGIERAQIDAAFPGFRLVIDEAVGQYEAAAPILSDVPAAPSREDLNDEIRGMRQKLQGSGTRGRRRWRARG
ncbi:MAG: hypothetical protein M3Q31_25140 [Actinomycetota bacterium]|nr:hypothetical protein [Actinomycetota bacterium]